MKKKRKTKKQITYIARGRAAAAFAGLVFFAVISYFVVTQDTPAFDTVVREYIYSLRGEGLTAFFTRVTYLGNWQAITLICCLFLLLPGVRHSFGIPLSATALTAALIQRVLKVSFHRARPDLTLHLITQGGYSFPSGHSFSVLIFYGTVIFLCRRNLKDKTAANAITALLSCLILLIGFSRVYLGVHYPTDVLGGWSLGLSVLMVISSRILFFDSRRKAE